MRRESHTHCWLTMKSPIKFDRGAKIPTVLLTPWLIKQFLHILAISWRLILSSQENPRISIQSQEFLPDSCFLGHINPTHITHQSKSPSHQWSSPWCNKSWRQKRWWLPGGFPCHGSCPNSTRGGTTGTTGTASGAGVNATSAADSAGGSASTAAASPCFPAIYIYAGSEVNCNYVYDVTITGRLYFASILNSEQVIHQTNHHLYGVFLESSWNGEVIGDRVGHLLHSPNSANLRPSLWSLASLPAPRHPEFQEFHRLRQCFLWPLWNKNGRIAMALLAM